MKITYTNAIHLQGIGLAHALPASELKVGDVTLWNYGGTATITAIKPKGKTQLVATLVADERGGQPTDRTLVGTRLIAVTKQTWVNHGRDPKEQPAMDTAKFARSIFGVRHG